jgi:predicted RNase H-like nuclease (RuvC/YqgF family)
VTVFGVDIVSGSSLSRCKKYAVFILNGSDSIAKVVSKVKLFRMVRKFKPSIIAIDNVFELFESKEELVSFLKHIPFDTKLVQVAGKQSLPSLAKRFGLNINIRNPMDEAKACAYLAKLGVGDEVSVFIDKTIITVTRNRSLGRGGWRQNKYRRKVHNSVRQVFNEIKKKLDELGLEYVEDVKHAYGGISKGVLVVNAPKSEIPISSFRFGDVQVKVEAVEKEKIEFIPLRKSKPFVIVGVDPGTTTAVAIADLNGNIIGVKSKKGWNYAEVVEYITSIGKPVVIATDKSHPPEFVSKLKASFNAVLWTPKEDMSVEKKRTLTSGYTYLNDHERDAIAVAISAYNSYKNKIRNIEKRIPAGFDADFVKAEVIRGTPLKDILSVEEKREVEVKKEESRPVEFRSTKVLEELKLENEVLRRKVRELKEEVERLRLKIVEMSKESYEKLRRDNYIRSLQSEIAELRKELKRKDEIIKELEEKVETLKRMKVLELKGWKSVKVLRKFTKEDIEELEKDFSICEGDVIFIEDASCGGKSTAEYLCNRGVKAVIVGNEMSHLAKSVFEERDIPVINAKDLEIMTSDRFAIVKCDVFERIYAEKVEELKKKKLDRIEALLIEYKRSRKF